ncbi:MAG: hypothetical protein ABIR81_03085 [Ginsengibacter sp.]
MPNYTIWIADDDSFIQEVLTEKAFSFVKFTTEKFYQQGAI